MTKRELEKYFKDLKRVTESLDFLRKKMWMERLRVGKLLRIQENEAKLLKGEKPCYQQKKASKSKSKTGFKFP